VVASSLGTAQAGVHLAATAVGTVTSTLTSFLSAVPAMLLVFPSTKVPIPIPMPLQYKPEELTFSKRGKWITKPGSCCTIRTKGGLMSTTHRGTLTALAMIAVLAGFPAPGRCEETKADPDPAKAEAKKHPVLMYIPNRIFDVLDLARARVRVGPGFTVQARATQALDVVLGAHATVFAGIPGPRGRPRINLPIGVETFAGAEISVAGDSTEEGWSKPYYGPMEVGAGFQAAIIGLDVGIDPLEIFDLVAGILFFDPLGDDY
jgi:hypothetical protein